MTPFQEVATIGAVVLGTVLTRALPFLFFPAGKPVPPLMRYLGRALPGAVFALLVVYSLKDTQVLTGNHGLPELIACLFTLLLHVWKRHFLFTIAGGTIAYMALVQLVFR